MKIKSKVNPQSTLFFLLVLLLFFSLFNGCSKKNTGRKYPGQIKPGSAEYILNEGIFYLNTGNLNMAEKKLLRALKKKPTLVAAINGLGIVYLNKREFPKAIKYFKQVIQINPKHYDAYNYLGVIYTETGKYEMAKENLLVAANAEKYRTPENALVNLAQLEIRQKKFQAARRYVEKGLDKNYRFAPLHNLKGIVLENQQDYEGAVIAYKEALSLLTEEDVTYLINIGRVYIKMGKRNQALDVLERALSKAFSPQQKVKIREMLKDIEKIK